MICSIIRNGSGYYDPTAYAAMKNVIKSEKDKKVNKMKQGEIWEIKQNNGQYKNVIVIAAHDDIAQVLQISEYGGKYSIEINCHGISYTDPRKLQYVFNDSFTNYIRTLKDEELETIMDAVAECLGIVASQEETVEPMKGESTSITVPAAELLPFDYDSEELIKAKTERDVFKGLYEKLLADVMKG